MFKNIKINKLNGFSFIEVMILLLILSLITAASYPLISRKHLKVPKFTVHGQYACFYDNGNLREQYYRKNRRISDENVTACKFVPPEKASFFYIQVIGAGGGGGGATSITRTETVNKANISPFNGSYSSYVTANEYLSEVSHRYIEVCAQGARGGRGGDLTVEEYIDEWSYLTTGGSRNIFGSLESCQSYLESPGGSNAVGPCERSIGSVKYYGEAGVLGSSCSVGAYATLNMSYDVQDGSPGQPSNNSTAHNQTYDRLMGQGNPIRGTDSSKGNAKLCVSSSCSTCNTTSGSGGWPARHDPNYRTVRSYVSEYTSACGGNSYQIGGSTSGLNSSKTHFSYSHITDKKSIKYGNPGNPGEYLFMFVRSFKDPVNIVVGAPGAAGANSTSGGTAGKKGGDTTFGAFLRAAGGSGGSSDIVNSGYTHYKCANASTCYLESCSPESYGSGSCSPVGVSTTHYTQNSGNGAYSAFAKNSIIAFNNLKFVMSDSEGPKSFGKAGKGAGIIDKCNVVTYYRQFANSVLENYTYTNSCSDSSEYTNTPESGKSGAVVITW